MSRGGDGMVSLDCPLCSENLKAADCNEMERLFKDHLRSMHSVRDFCTLDSHNHIKGSIQSCQPEVIAEAKGIPREPHDRPVFEYSRIDQIDHMPPSLPTRVTTLGSEMLDVRCPICGVRV